MSDENSRTIDSYESRFNEYVAATTSTVQGPMKQWLDDAVKELPLDAKILEIGSGFGRDAQYLQSQGYAVECTDATKSFITILEARGFDAHELNVITDKIPGMYDLVLANAVLLHFTNDEVMGVLKKIYDALNPSGKFAFSVIEGEGEQWTDGKIGLPRYFNYWCETQLNSLLKDAGYKKVTVKVAGRPDDKKWLMVTAYK